MKMLEIKSDGKIMTIETRGSGKEILASLAGAVSNLTSMMDREAEQAKGTALSILFKIIWCDALNETEEEDAETERVPLS